MMVINFARAHTYVHEAGHLCAVPSEDKRTSCSPQTTMFKAVVTSPGRVRHAHGHGLTFSSVVFHGTAGMYADVATLEAAHQLMQYEYATLWGAARCNELEVVQFLRAQGCPWSALTCSAAAGSGRTDMCAYLHGEKCACSQDTCLEAASNGYCSTLRWLREHGCPWHETSIPLAAAEGGSVDAMVFLQQQGIAFGAMMLTQMLQIAGAYNQLAAAQWLRAQGAEWPAKLRWHQDWPPAAVAWARAEGCTTPTDDDFVEVE
jgi:hypothetical protein